MPAAASAATHATTALMAPLRAPMGSKDLATTLSTLSDAFYTYVLAVLLVAVGLYFTALTRGVQVRHFGSMLRSITSSRRSEEHTSELQSR